jgi:hypothetical protein
VVPVRTATCAKTSQRRFNLVSFFFFPLKRKGLKQGRMNFSDLVYQANTHNCFPISIINSIHKFIKLIIINFQFKYITENIKK